MHELVERLLPMLTSNSVTVQQCSDETFLLCSERPRVVLGHAPDSVDEVAEADGVQVVHDVVPDRQRRQPPARKRQLGFGGR